MEWQCVGIPLSPHRAGSVAGKWFQRGLPEGARVHELMFKQVSGLNETSRSEVHECK